MGTSFYNMELKQFKELFTDHRQIVLGDDFCVVDVRHDRKMVELRQPVRLDAYVLLFCIKGKICLNVNMKEFTMTEDQMAVLLPGYVGHVVDLERADKEEDVHSVWVCVSRSFLSTLQLDLHRILARGTMLLDNPCIRLTPEEKAIAVRYLDLASAVLEADVPNKRECISSLISSLLYLSEAVFGLRPASVRAQTSARSSRAEDIFGKFVRLLADYHTRERSIGFYAGKLCLSPKYFSKLIKTASGRSAPDWIDSFVILEAKNYLKYSELSIKQIVCQLHFSDQPTFTKFFKSHTGMTPAQFRRSRSESCPA